MIRRNLKNADNLDRISVFNITFFRPSDIYGQHFFSYLFYLILICLKIFIKL